MLGPPKARELDRPVVASLEALVPPDHFYRYLDATLDLSFVRDWARDCYAAIGRPSIDPVVFFRLQLILFFAGLRSEPLVSYGYVAAKAALNNAVRHAAVDLAPYNVRVNAIAPGPFLTNIAGGRLHREPDAIKKFIAMVPMGRIAQPDEIKGLALLLASPAGSYITGAVIPIDGGTTAK